MILILDKPIEAYLGKNSLFIEQKSMFKNISKLILSLVYKIDIIMFVLIVYRKLKLSTSMSDGNIHIV